MRVISGLYKGKVLKGFDIDGTRPTQDRVKESIFGSIQDYISDSVVLDLFSGSGNLGIEALSNGAKECYFVDNNKIAIDVIKDNTKDIDNSNIMNMDYKLALDKFKDIKFDLIFLDPPYSLNCIDYVVSFILENDMLNNNGLIICEYENEIKKDYDSLDIIKEKKYGFKKVVIFRK